MRVGIVGLSHESNTFLAATSDRDRFDVQVGDGIRERWTGTNHEVAGYLDGLDAAGLEAVGVQVATAMPGGRIDQSTFDGLVDDMAAELARLGPFDGILAAAHGAAVAERIDDADAAWLGRVRDVVGADVPIVVTTDAHANLSTAMLDGCDALIAYRTNPHLDTHARGVEAAELMARTLASEVRPVARGAFPPMAIGITQQATAEPPSLQLYELAERIRTRTGILSVSILLGFPYADVAEVGTSFAVVSDGDERLAKVVLEGVCASAARGVRAA